MKKIVTGGGISHYLLIIRFKIDNIFMFLFSVLVISMRTMTSVCYLIVCINLLYSFDQTESFEASSPVKVREHEKELFLKALTIDNQYDYLANSKNPYWNLTYDEQLAKKQISCSKIVYMIVRRSDRLRNLMTYKFYPIVPSPVTKEYRNNDVFHIRTGVDGNPKTVGLIIGDLKFKTVFSIHPTKIGTIRESHKRVAQVYEDFIRLSSLPANIDLNDGGHWKTLNVRSNEAGEVVVSVSVQPTGYNDSVIEKERKNLKDYFIKHLPNISLFHQMCSKRRCKHVDSPYVLQYGKPYLLETLNGFRFKITPYTIFPANTLGAGVFYDTLFKAANLKHYTTVLDIFSGQGINSIVVSKYVRRAVGLEYNMEDVQDAKDTASFNNISNAKFVGGRVFNLLRLELKKLYPTSDVVVILNHRLVGLGSDIMTTIRGSPNISRLFYIYYKPGSQKFIQNFIHLCNYKNKIGPPFKLTKVIPIDQHPQSTFVEMILMFERVDVR